MIDVADEIQELAWIHLGEQLPHGTAWRPVEAWRALKVSPPLPLPRRCSGPRAGMPAVLLLRPDPLLAGLLAFTAPPGCPLPQVERGEVAWVDRRAMRYAYKMEQQALADNSITSAQVGK
jgi:hypothetical protein